MNNKDIELLFLGTGTSQGVPVIACNCEVCNSSDLKDKRLRSSVCVKVRDKTFIIDIGPDFRQQVLREDVKKVDAFLLTHSHRDHTAGLDEIRSFNYAQRKALPLYAQKLTIQAIQNDFSYIFEPNPYPGVPQIELMPISKEHPFFIENIQVTPIEVTHMHMPVLGYRIGDFTYITDANAISDVEMKKIEGTKVFVINALGKEKHPSHFSLQEALHIIDKIKPEKAYLTHISHMMGFHKEVSAQLPSHIHLAYDGLSVKL